MDISTINPIDRDALQLCIDQTLAEDDADRVEQVQWMLSEREWIETARFCCYHKQFDALGLLPWQSTPSEVDDPPDLSTPQGKLVKRMLGLGISRFDPDPISAIQAAERKPR
jgi:hypothetical protein